MHRGEPERVREDLGPGQIGFLEREPRDVVDLDDRIARSPGVLAPMGTLLAVQVWCASFVIVGVTSWGQFLYFVKIGLPVPGRRRGRGR